MKISNFVSYLFHPIFITTYIFVILSLFSPIPFYLNYLPLKSWWALFFIILLYSAVFPLVVLKYMEKKQLIESIKLENIKDRPQALLLMAAFYIGLCYFLFSKNGILKPLSIIVFIVIVNILGLALISFKTKISLHASASAGLVAILATSCLKFQDYNLFLPFLFMLIISGMVCTARLKLNAHSLKEVTFGYLWGLFCGITGILVLI